MATSPRDKFIDLISKNCQVDGFDELTSKIVGTLFIEPTEVALEDLAKMTGYSLSAVSTAMKLVVRAGLVKRMKKPGSRKVYFYMEKDLIKVTMQLMQRKHELVITKTKRELPNIIEKYRTEKSKASKEELQIIKGYSKQVLVFEKIIGSLIHMLEVTENAGDSGQKHNGCVK